MSGLFEQPFHEYEERYVLAEILKASSIPSGVLFKVIEQSHIDPAWTEIALPTGRSISACQKAYFTIKSRQSPGQFSTFAPPPPISELRAAPPQRSQRSLSFGEPPAVAERVLQPRPTAFAPVNGQEQVEAGTSRERPKKKRGRPSKVEHEQRVAEAAARGEVYPPPRKPKTARASTGGETAEEGGAPTPIMFVPSQQAESPQAGKKKKPRLSKGDPAVTASKALEEVLSDAERMIPETQLAGPTEPVGAAEADLPTARIKDSDTPMEDVPVEEQEESLEPVRRKELRRELQDEREPEIVESSGTVLGSYGTATGPGMETQPE